ncbi:MAG: SRPBCC family protein [Armatimonadota bacterium]|nr:SRPBCC family protein [Armatimonadota bacterium]
MPTIHLETQIDVPVEVCFDLARDLDLHCRTTAHTRERIVGAGANRLIEAGDVVTFEAVHLGVRQRLTAKIVEMERPVFFADEMVQGAFQSLRHVHEFRPQGAGTLMTDTLNFTSPLGVLGRLADRLFLERYLRRFLTIRNQNLKAVAETEYSQRSQT